MLTTTLILNTWQASWLPTVTLLQVEQRCRTKCRELKTTHIFADDKNEADLWLLNSCTVKTPAEDHFKNEIDDGRSRNIPVVVAGCGKINSTNFVSSLIIVLPL